MNLVLIVFAYLCCRSIARDLAPLFFDMFLEKTKLKDDSSHDVDWVHDLRIILICCTEVLCPWCTARWQTYCRCICKCYECLKSSVWWLLDSLVHHALRLRTGTSKMFWTPWNIWDVPRVEIGILDLCPCPEVWELWQLLRLQDGGE